MLHFKIEKELRSRELSWIWYYYFHTLYQDPEKTLEEEVFFRLLKNYHFRIRA